MKTNHDDVRGTHAAIYSSRNGLAHVSPTGELVSLPRQKNPFDGNATEETDVSALWGPYTLLHRGFCPLAPLLRFFFHRTRWDQAKKPDVASLSLMRNGVFSVFVLATLFFLPWWVLSLCSSHSAAIFQRPHEPTPFRESWRNESGCRRGAARRGGTRLPLCVQGCIIRVQRNLSACEVRQTGNLSPDWLPSDAQLLDFSVAFPSPAKLLARVIAVPINYDVSSVRNL